MINRSENMYTKSGIDYHQDNILITADISPTVWRSRKEAFDFSERSLMMDASGANLQAPV